MKNLRYFFHYCQGDKKEKAIKIFGSFLVVTALFIWSSAISLGRVSEEEGGFLADLLPEPGYLVALAEDIVPLSESLNGPTQAVPSIPDTEPQTKEDARGDMNGDNEKRDREEQERQAQETKRWKNDRLREAKNLAKEIDKVKKQVLRLKGSADEINKLEAIRAGLSDFVSKVNATTDTDDLRIILEDTDFSEWWESMNLLRAAVEIPRDLNKIRADQKRVQSQLKQKWVCKIVDCEKFLPIIKNMNEQLEKATGLYKAGELEDARLAIQETFHDKGWFGDAMGAVQMMRGFQEPLRQVKDKALKEEITSLFEPVLEALYDGETREARETMEAIQRELGPAVFKAIDNAQKRRKDVPENVLQKIEQLRQKFEQTEPMEE